MNSSSINRGLIRSLKSCMTVQNWQTKGSRINYSSYRTQAKLMDSLLTVRHETTGNFRGRKKERKRKKREREL
jgi:hypothetical protein